MPCLGARKDGRDHEGNEQGEHEGQHQAGAGDLDFARDKTVFQRVSEQKFTDEGAEAGSEHADVQVLLDIQVPHPHIEHGRKKAGPHVQEIEAVEAVGDDQEKAGQGIRVGIALQVEHEKAHADAAGAGVQEGGRQASEMEVVCDQGPRRGHDPDPVGEDFLRGETGIDRPDGGGGKECKGKETGDPIYDPAVMQSAFWSAHAVFT